MPYVSREIHTRQCRCTYRMYQLRIVIVTLPVSSSLCPLARLYRRWSLVFTGSMLLNPNFTWLVTSRHDTTRAQAFWLCRACQAARLDALDTSNVSFRVETWRDVMNQVEFGYSLLVSICSVGGRKHFVAKIVHKLLPFARWRQFIFQERSE